MPRSYCYRIDKSHEAQTQDTIDQRRPTITQKIEIHVRAKKFQDRFSRASHEIPPCHMMTRIKLHPIGLQRFLEIPTGISLSIFL